MDLYIDPATGDIALDNYTIRLTGNNAEITRQRIEATLKTYRGEWFTDRGEGIPYLENDNNTIQLLGRARKEEYDSYIKQAVLAKPYVTGISYYSSILDRANSTLTISLNIVASDGTDTGEFSVII